jgi:hypothetical protein
VPAARSSAPAPAYAHNTNSQPAAAPRRRRNRDPRKVLWRYSVYLLYWYKSTNTDALLAFFRLCQDQPSTRGDDLLPGLYVCVSYLHKYARILIYMCPHRCSARRKCLTRKPRRFTPPRSPAASLSACIRKVLELLAPRLY